MYKTILAPKSENQPKMKKPNGQRRKNSRELYKSKPDLLHQLVGGSN